MNRRQRKAAERATGYDKMYRLLPSKEQAEIRDRRRKAGDELHKRHLEDIATKQAHTDDIKRDSWISNKVDEGMDLVAATKIVDDMIESRRKERVARKLKLAKRHGDIIEEQHTSENRVHSIRAGKTSRRK